MSRTTTRVAAGALLGLAVTGSTLIAAPAAFAAPAAPVVAPGSVVAEEVFTVSGTECPKSDVPHNPNIVMVGIDDGSEYGLGNGTFPEADGTWSVELAFEAGTAPKAYDIHAACVDYLGFYGVEGATPTTDIEYPVATVTLLDPAAEPSTPSTPSTPTTSTPATTEAPTPAPTGTTSGTATVTTDAKGVVTVTAAPGQSLSPSAPVEVGEKQILRLTGYTPGEEVTLVLHSTPRRLGTATADASGVVTFAFTAPSGTEAGDHHVKVTRADGSVVSYPIRIAAASSASSSDELAYTGADVTAPLVAGTGLVLLGGATVFAARRRKAAAQL
jgi:LPXTG-motif cell wall-anchored protein